MNHLGGEPGRTVISQNGVKYRTICKACNDYIGAEYDPTMNAFARSVGLYLRSTLRLPIAVGHTTKPQRLLKALLAHLVAAKVEIEDTTFDQLARSYVLDPQAQLSDDINVFYWVFPYEEMVVMRDFAMFTPRGTFQEPAVFQLLKSFPVAFLCSTAKSYAGLDCLSPHRGCGLDAEIAVPIRLLPIHDRCFPETPTGKNNGVLFGGASAMQGFHATPRNRRMRRAQRR